MSDRMQWTNALSTRPSLEAAVTEVVEAVQSSLAELPDLGIVFISSAYASDYPRLIPLLREQLSLPILIGCGGGGIVGMESVAQVAEIEGNPALSLTVAHLPGVKVHSFYLTPEDLPDLDSSPTAWTQAIGISPQDPCHFILLSEPFSARINDLLEGLDFAYPGSIKIGGLASMGTSGNQSALFYQREGEKTQSLYREGTVGVALSGQIVVETIVAQGCRPIGPVYRVSEGERNVIVGLADLEGQSASRSPLEMLRELIQSLDERDRELAQHSLFVGIAGDEFKLNLQPGDFLIRNLIGVDPRVGAIAIGDRVRPGGRVQFHLRDARTSAEDLEWLLSSHLSGQALNRSPARGALMFSCLGRGEGLYGVPNFDSTLFRRFFPDLPIGGFFCNGEIGQVGGRTFLHGYTSAFAIFRQPL